ncbi:MAG: hypothetical protein QOF21_1268 [Actinomycetota bacterium]
MFAFIGLPLLAKAAGGRPLALVPAGLWALIIFPPRVPGLLPEVSRGASGALGFVGLGVFGLIAGRRSALLVVIGVLTIVFFGAAAALTLLISARARALPPKVIEQLAALAPTRPGMYRVDFTLADGTVVERQAIGYGTLVTSWRRGSAYDLGQIVAVRLTGSESPPQTHS